jgi:hypothetical protein
MAEDRNSPLRREWVAWVVVVVTRTAALTAALCLDGQLGPISFTLRRLTAAAVLIPLALSKSLPTKRSRAAHRFGVAVVLVLLSRSPSVTVALVGFVLALAVSEIGVRRTPSDVGRSLPPSRGPSDERPLPDVLALACFTYVALGLAVELVPQANAFPAAAAQYGSRYLGHFRGITTRSSFTALGGPSVQLAALYLLVRYRAIGGLGRSMVVAVLGFAWFSLLGALAPDSSAGPIAVFSNGSLTGLSWLPLAVAVAVPLPDRRPMPEATFPRGAAQGLRSQQRNVLGRRRLLLAVACLTAVSSGVCLTGAALIGPARAKSISVHNYGGLDWDRPVFGRFGGFSGGMFGLLPVYCRAEGFQFDVLDKSAVEPPDLEKTQILVLINSPKLWDDRERKTVLDFVARGGSLLVLGDHTDVFGLMRGFNSLLGRLGIQFRFDSAMKARQTWRGCQVTGPDAVAWGWNDENPGVAVGASLELSGWARPLLVGRYAFSDQGVRENTIGSFLGNYHYDQGEQLGDLVLVAATTYGRGRVVVWGDTSAFQGVSSYWPTVVGPSFAWLSRPTSWTERPPFRIAAAIGLLATIVWLLVVRGTALETAVIAAGLLAGLWIPWLLSLPNMDSDVRIGRDVFLIDRSHMPASGHYEARVNPVGPLYTNVLRSGFRTADLEDWDAAAIKRSRGIAFVAPHLSLTRREIDEVLEAEKDGAVVLLTTGEPDSHGSRAILEAHGLALAPRPLGTVTSSDIGASRREREKVPRFLDAWPIVTASSERDPATLPGVEVIYRHGEDVVELFRRVGKGGLLLISDTRFFSDGNVEDMSGFWPGNLTFIHDIFKRYLETISEPTSIQFRTW